MKRLKNVADDSAVDEAGGGVGGGRLKIKIINMQYRRSNNN